MDEQQIIANDEAIAKANQPEARTVMEPNTTKYESIDVATKMDMFRELNLDMNLLNDDAVNSRVKDISDWARIKNPDMNLRDIVFMIQEVQNRVGRYANKSALDNVWEYSTLDIERMKIDGRIKLMENQNG